MLALAVATCTQDNVGPSRGVGYFSFRPDYQLAGGASLSQFGIVADSVHIRLTRPVDEVVLDTSIAFPADSAELHLALPVVLATSPEVLSAVIAISAGGVVIFLDSVDVTVQDGPPGGDPPPVVTLDYIGPGSNIGTLQIAPGDTTVVLGDTLFFTAAAFDSSAAPVASFYVGWSTSDTSVARINGNGRLISPAGRGTVKVIGTTPTGIVDTTTVVFAPVPVIITADSGNAQTGIVGDSLGALFVARVKGADSLGISGIPVRFAAVTAGGAVRDTVTLFTDAQGRVRTRAVLGTTVQGYSYSATALGTGLPARTFTATASAAAAASIAIQSGNGQTDTVGQTLPLPLTARVTDAFTNPVAGANVVFTRIAGSGTPVLDTIATDAAGLAPLPYTLGGSAGIDSIRAALVGTSGFVTFSATAISAAPTQIIQVTGAGQTAVAGTTFTDSLAVNVLDASDNPVGGVWVHWIVASGSLTLSADSSLSDASGHAAVRLTAGTVAGAAAAHATVTGIVSPSVFNETVTAAAAASMIIASGDGQSGNAGTILPLPLVVRVVDTFGNRVAGTAVAFAVTGGGGSLDSATATTNANGDASGGSWTLGGSAGGNQVRATSAAVPADTLFFNATGLPAGTSKVWTGALSNLWGTAGNWSPAGVPVASDNVFIPAGATSPFLSSTSNANDLTIESGAVLNTGSFVLNISGNLDVAGNIAGAGFPTMNGVSTTLRGSIASYLGITGSITLNGPFSTSGQLDISAGSLNVGGQVLTVGGNLTLNGSGALVMQNAADSVRVSGATTYNGSTTSGLLTAGKLVLLGGFSEPSGSAVFRASGTHRTIFAGASPQSVSFGSAGLGGNQFQDVEFANAAGVTLGSNIAAGGTVSITAGVVSGAGRTATLGGSLDDPTSAGWDVTSTVLTADPALLPDTLRHDLFVAGNVVLTKDLVVRGNFGHTGGILTMNGFRVRVDSALTVSGSAQLRMQHPADTLDVGGSTSWNGSTTAGLLTTGTLILRGNFSEPSGSAVFRASGSHKTIFAGSAAQSVSFGSSGLGGNQFQDVEFANPAGVTLATNFAAGGSGSVTAGQVVGAGRTATIQGNVLDPSNASWRPDVTVLTGTPTTLPDSFARSLFITGTTILGKPLVVHGNLSQSAGTFNLNGYRVRVDSALTVSGSAQLLMQNPADTLEVLGATSWNGSTAAGFLTEGTLLLRGDFSEPSGSAVFRASGSHKTIFAGSAPQSVSFGSSGLGGNQFQDVEFANPAGVTLATDFAAGGTGAVTAGQVVGVARTATIQGNVVDPSNGSWLPDLTVLAGTPTALPDSFARNLSITGTTLLGKSLVVRANLSQSAGILTLNGFKLRADSGLTVTGSAQLRMQNVADTLEVSGTTSWNGSTTAGLLTAGTFLVRGDFSEPSGSAVFRASGTHRTVFTGSAAQSVSFGSSGLGGNQFQDVEFANAAGVTLATDIAAGGSGSVTAGQVTGTTTATVAGNIVDTTNVSWRPAFTILTGTPTSLPDSFARNVTFSGTVLLGKPLVVRANLSQTAGAFTLNGYDVRVDSALTISGSAQLIMQNAADSLDVAGAISWNGSTTAGLLTNGVLVIRSGFLIPTGSSVFQPSGTHRTVLAGTGGALVSLAGGASYTGNRFNILEIVPGASTLLGSPLFATVSVTKPAGAVATLSGTGAFALNTRALAVDGMVFDSVNLIVRGAPVTTFNNVTFQRQDPALLQLQMIAAGTPSPVAYTNVAFTTTPTTGKYIWAADSLGNGEAVHIQMVQSTPLDGSAFENQVAGGDGALIDWSSLGFADQPLDAAAGDTLAPIRVAVLDPAGDTATFYGGSVTLVIGTNPGGGSLTGTTTVAAVGGIATFDDIAITSAGAGYTLDATAAGLATATSLPFTVSVPLPAGTTTAFNNGGGDNDWFNGANWTAGTPDSLDNVFVYPGQTVTVNTPARANRVVVGTGAGIVLNAPLTVDSSVAAGNTITGGGQLIAQGNGTLDGQVGDLLITGSYSVTPGGHLRAQTLVIDGIASLNVLGDSVTVTDSLATQNSGVLNVNGAGAVVDVAGDVRFGGGTSVLVAGKLRLHGNLHTYALSALQSDPAFDLDFAGPGTQLVVLAGSDSGFALPHLTMLGDTLRFLNPAWVNGNVDLNAGVTIIDSSLFTTGTVGGAAAAGLQGNSLALLGDLTFPGAYAVANTNFAGTGIVIPALATPYDTLYVSGTAQIATDLAASAFFVIGAGSFELAGNRVDVTGDFGTLGTATFRMTDPADTLMVGGSFYASGGSTTGLLTDGLLQVGGNFIQGNYIPCCVEIIVTGPLPAFDAFNADTGHVTRLTGGAEARFLYFSNPLDPTGLPGTSSKFGTLELVDGVDSLYSTVPVAGRTTITGGDILGGTLATVGPLTVLSGVATFAPASLYTGGGIDYQAPNVTYNVPETFFFGGDSIPVLPYQWLRVGFTTMALTGDLTVGSVRLGGQGEFAVDSYNGTLVLNGHALTTSGDFEMAGFGRMAMIHPTDSLDVGGSFNANGGQTSGLVTDGVIVARGAVYVTPNWEDSSFVATGNNRFRMEAPGATTLSIVQGSVPANRFSKFTVASGTAVSFNPFQDGDLIATDSLVISGSLTQASAGQKIVAFEDLYVGFATGIAVDTVELHKDLEVSAAGYSVGFTRYAGTGQLITPSVTYQDLEVTGTVAMDSTTVVNRDVYVSGNGSLDLGSVELDAGRTFRTRDNGVVTMASPTAVLLADTADFSGGSTAGLLTAGTLRTRALLQSNATSDESYAPSTAHLTQIGTPLGGSEYRIQMATGDGPSRINDLLMNDGGVGGVPTRIVGRVLVAGTVTAVSEGSLGFIGDPGAFLSVADSLIFQDPAADIALDTVQVAGVVEVPSNTFFSTVVRFAGTGQAIPDTQSYQVLQVTGTASPEGLATINAAEVTILGSGRLTLGSGQRVSTSGDFATLQGGTLAMVGAGADLFVGGNALFAGGSAGALMADGTIRVAGNFTTQSGNSIDPFNSFNTGVTFQGSGGTQLVTIDPLTNVNFRGVGIINPFGIQISGLMLVTDTVGTSGPITGDSLYQFGPFNLNASVAVDLKVFKTAGLFSGLPSSYTVGRTHITNANSLPNVPFDTLVVNANGVSAFYPLSASTLIIAASGSPWASGPDGVLDLGAYGGVVNHVVTGDVRIEGAGAQLKVAEDTLSVGGDLYTSLGGTVDMSGPGALLVAGSTLFGGGSQIGLMTSGTLRVGSGITQQAFSSPSSFRMDGTTLDLPVGPAHVLNFETPDSSWLPDINAGGASALNLIIVNRARVAGGINGYGLGLSGDTLITSGQLSAGPIGVSMNLLKYEGPVYNTFTNFPTYSVAVTQFTAPGDLPFNTDFTFDTLYVSDSVVGALSQLLTANYVEVTGPGNPKHVGAEPGILVLTGGDGNTTLNVSGDVVVRGTGAGLVNSMGLLQTTGDFTVDQDAYFAAFGSFGGGNYFIGGDVVIDGTITRDSLVKGLLQIGGDFTQKGTTAGASFAPDSTFTTAFTGAGPHGISFQTPSARGSTGSYFGALAVGDAPVATVIHMAGDYYVEGTLSTGNSNGVTFQNDSANLGRLNAQDVAVQNITFDHLQFRLEKHSGPAAGAGMMDIVSFTNFQNDEQQFVVTLPGGGAGPFTWSNFTFTQLAASGLDTGRYIVATDWDGPSPSALNISLGTNQSGDPANYFVGLNGATVSPFAP